MSERHYFKDKEYIRTISFMNVTARPPYVDIQLLPKKIFNAQIEKYITLFENINNNKKKGSAWILSEPLLKQKHRPILDEMASKELFFEELDKMNKHRGFDLCNHITELKEWRDSK